jgi:hypothetical protein
LKTTTENAHLRQSTIIPLGLPFTPRLSLNTAAFMRAEARAFPAKRTHETRQNS